MYRSNRCRVERVKLTTLAPFQTPSNTKGNHPCGVTAVGGYDLTTLELLKTNPGCTGLMLSINDEASVQMPAQGQCVASVLPLTIGRAEYRRRAVFAPERHAEGRADG